MALFNKTIDHAKESLAEVSREAIDHAGERLADVVKVGVSQAGTELKDVIWQASQEIDAKLDKISDELHEQRQFTKDDVRELVDYAGEKLGTLMDERIVHAKAEFSSLVQEKVEYFKREVDGFFIERQRDLARERRRLFINIAIAVFASLSLGFVSWLYHQYLGGGIDVFAIFRIVFASLVGGYAAFLAVKLLRHWLSMSEHKKDALFLASRYWGVLRPESIFGTVVLVCLMAALVGFLLFPEQIAQLTGSEKWLKTLREAYPIFKQ
jgi:vacuolar-type H+-ATPase subunit H/nitrate reductase NapE component